MAPLFDKGPRRPATSQEAPHQRSQVGSTCLASKKTELQWQQDSLAELSRHYRLDEAASARLASVFAERARLGCDLSRDLAELGEHLAASNKPSALVSMKLSDLRAGRPIGPCKYAGGCPRACAPSPLVAAVADARPLEDASRDRERDRGRERGRDCERERERSRDRGRRCSREVAPLSPPLRRRSRHHGRARSRSRSGARPGSAASFGSKDSRRLSSRGPETERTAESFGARSLQPDRRTTSRGAS